MSSHCLQPWKHGSSPLKGERAHPTYTVNFIQSLARARRALLLFYNPAYSSLILRQTPAPEWWLLPVASHPDKGALQMQTLSACTPAPPFPPFSLRPSGHPLCFLNQLPPASHTEAWIQKVQTQKGSCFIIISLLRSCIC